MTPEDLITQFGGVFALLVIYRLYILPSIMRMHADADRMLRQLEALQDKLGCTEEKPAPVPEPASPPDELPTEPPQPLPIARAIRRPR